MQKHLNAPLSLKNAHPHAHKFIHVHKHWGCSHLRNAKYLPLLSAWMAAPISALSLWLSINLTFKDSSPPGCYSNSETKYDQLSQFHFCCYFSFCSTDSLRFHTAYRCLSNPAGIWEGNKHLNMQCSHSLVDVNNEPMLKSPLQSICTRKWMLNIESVLDVTDWTTSITEEWFDGNVLL